MLLAGGTIRPGWKTLDAKGSVDYLATIPPLPAEVKAVRWDAIELIHGIASFYPWDADKLLREIRSVLSPDGVLVLEQPDFILALQQGGRVEWLFGDPEPRDPLHMVKWSYTPESLSDLLWRCGFRRVEVKPAVHHIPARDFRIEARV